MESVLSSCSTIHTARITLQQSLKMFDTVRTHVVFKAVICFFVMYSFLIVCAIPLFLLFLYRSLLSLVLKVYHHGKYKLVDCSSAAYTAWDSFANVVNITCFVYIDGECKINKLRERVANCVLSQDKHGKRPYGILLNSTVEKFGFMCLSDESTTIDFRHHVRVLPTLEQNPNQIYEEFELLKVVADLANNEWVENRPKWEILVTPQVIKDGKLCSVVILKFHHFYVDGISLIQFLRNCVADQPAPKLMLDPVNTPIPPVPYYAKILLALQIFFMGPYISLRLFGNQHDPVFSEGPLTGNKLIGRAHMKISKQMMSRIRRYHGCRTQSVFHSAFLGSFQKMARKKGILLPEKTIGGVVYANFPYPDEFPINNACFGYEPMKCGIEDPMKRLDEVNKSMMLLNKRQYALKSSLILMRFLGLYPASLIRYSVQFFKMSYYISNVPGTQEYLRFDGKKVDLVFGIAPIGNQIRYSCGIGFYEGNFQVGFLIEKSKIIENRFELEEWIELFEKEVAYLDAKASQPVYMLQE